MNERLAELLDNPACAAQVPLEAVAELLGWLELVKARLLERVIAGPTPAAPGPNLRSSPYDLAEAAELIHKSPTWLRREAAAGRVPCARKVGRSWLFARADFDAFWRRHRRA